MKNKKPLITLLIIVVIAAVAGIGFYFLEREVAEDSDNKTEHRYTESQKKAIDARAKSDLFQIRSIGSMKREEGNYDFSVFCEDKDVKNLIEYELNQFGRKIICNDSRDSWAAQVDLQASDYKYFCTDGNLNQKEGNQPLGELTQCP